MMGFADVHRGFCLGRKFPLRHFVALMQRISLQQLKNARTPQLSANLRIMAAMPQFLHRESNKQRKKTLVGSTRWRRQPDFLEIVARGELKELISLSYKDAGR
jgi:hypothetical protein